MKTAHSKLKDKLASQGAKIQPGKRLLTDDARKISQAILDVIY